MKIVIKILCIVLFLTALSGCKTADQPQVSTDPSIPSTADTEPTASTEVNPQFPQTKYVVFSDFINYDCDHPDVTYIHRYDYDNIKFSFLPKSYIDPPEQTTKDFTVDGVQYTLVYIESERYLDNAPEFLRQNNCYDVYSRKYDGKETSITIHRDTGRVIAFDTDVKNQNPNITKDQAIEAAKELFTELYGQERLDLYNRIRIDDYNNIIFERTLYGYATRDYVFISYSRDGSLCHISAYRLGRFDEIAQEVTAEMIADAEAALLSTILTIKPEWEVESKYLEIGSDGRCYLTVYFDDHDEVFGHSHTQSLTINVN
jgi:hypothetical protein